LGTPWYMSPEQCEGKPLDHRTDLYSLGATYYTLLTRKTPYHEASGMIRVMYLHCDGPVPDPRSGNPAIPDSCCRIVTRAMAKDPSARYQSTGEMLTDLEAVLKDLSGQRPACRDASLEIRTSNFELRPSVKGQSATPQVRKSKIEGRRAKP